MLDGMQLGLCFVKCWKRDAVCRQAIPEPKARTSCLPHAPLSSGVVTFPSPFPQVRTFSFNSVLSVFVRQRPEHIGALCDKVHDRMQKQNALESSPTAHAYIGSIIKTATPGYSPADK